ncbi:TorF family putative porin [Acinetobacter piscicola]|uniref:TorF family putative porin n=1 Tax=Acinetobacter piscicola TaxID=2006115 RepID=UPI000B7E6591|nr:TorF family putative porin [Acinetobacter piscicola]
MQLIFSKILWAVLVGVFSCSAIAEESKLSVANGLVSGNIGLVSKYIYHGGVENDDLAIQGGLEYAHKSGISIGYWGSTLNYDPSDETQDHGFEHNIFLSYGQEIAQNWSYNLKTTAYVYQKGGSIYADQSVRRKTTAFDVLGELAYKNLTLGTSVMLADASSANAGDLYFSAAYSHPLTQGFTFNAVLGASAYNSSRDDEIVQTKKDFALNEVRFGISKEVAQSGVTASFDYVLGGENRLGEDFDNNVIFGLNYSF